MPSYVATDTETTGVVWSGTYEERGLYPARPFAFSFCNDKGDTEYIRWEVEPKTRRVIVPPPRHGDWRVIKDVMLDASIVKVFHNASFDRRMYRLIGVDCLGRYEDTLPLMHTYTAGDEMTYGLKPLSDKFLGLPADEEKQLKEAVKLARKIAKAEGFCIADKKTGLFGNDEWKADMWLPFEGVPQLCDTYCRGDSYRTLGLFFYAYDRVREIDGLWRTYCREMDLLPYVERMEDKGMMVFPENVFSCERRYGKLRDQYEQQFWDIAGEVISPRGERIKELFYEERGFEPRFTETFNEKKGRNNYRLNGNDIADYAQIHRDPLAEVLQELKATDNMFTNFLRPFRAHMHEESAGQFSIHTSIRQVGPVTGRMASSDPNLMNVASEASSFSQAKTRMRPRECFGPRPGCIWYMPDYSQIEVWMFAYIAQYKTMIDALVGGGDFHDTITQQVFGQRPDFHKGTRKKHYRKRAKMIQFIKFYGGGVHKAALAMREPVHVAQGYIDDYDERLPGVSVYMKAAIAQLHRDGYIESPYGRRYVLPPSHAYKIVNYNTQGPAADCFKEGIIYTQEMLDSEYPGSQVLLPLHDELIIEVPLEYHSKRLMRDIDREMRKPGEVVGAPLKVEFSVSTRRWNQERKVEHLI